MSAVDIDADCIDDVITAVGEALANAIEHAYPAGSSGDIEIVATLEGRDRVVVAVTDHGSFVEREERAGRGFGLRIVRQIARDVQIDTARGTTIRMTFDTHSRNGSP
jgi:anti-sigma regulatory factor (Ser/Thr protein kinase)